MQERFVEIATADGVMEAFVAHPEEGGPFPCIVLFQDFWGLREEIYDLVRKVAVTGYYCMVPDLYYRVGKQHLVEYRNDKNEMMSSWRIEKHEFARAMAPLSKHTDEMFMSDTAAVVRFADESNDIISERRMGSFGYCLGGRLAIKAAAQFPQRFMATASLHGTYLVEEKPTSAHHLIPNIRGEIYLGCAELDPYLPLESVAKFQESLVKHNIKHRVEIHKGAQHGYAMPNRDVFDKRAYNRDWECIFAMFRRQLPLER